MKDQPLWLRTPEAAAWLGCSSQYLKKNRDLKDGPLEEGIHYVYGASLNSPIRWEVKAIKEIFHYKGKLIRKGQDLISELQKEGLNEPLRLHRLRH